MKMVLCVIPLFFLLQGCVTSGTGKGDCEYLERDLTVSFEQRTYWCPPKK